MIMCCEFQPNEIFFFFFFLSGRIETDKKVEVLVFKPRPACPMAVRGLVPRRETQAQLHPVKSQWGRWLPLTLPLLAGAYLQEPDEQRHSTHGVHEVAVVAQQGSPAASHPQVELLRLVVIAVVCRVVGELVLDAGPW